MRGRWSWTALAAGGLLAMACGAAPTVGPPTPTGTPGPTCPVGATAPPKVTLNDVSGSSIDGKLGSYDFCGRATEAPWPAGASMPAVALSRDEPNILVSVTDGPPVVTWGATYADSIETGSAIETNLTHASNFSGVDTISFGGLPTGDWTLRIGLTFAGEQGEANYFWHVTAP